MNVTVAQIDKLYKAAVNRNLTAPMELKRAALDSPEIKARVRREVQKEIYVLETKHKMPCTQADLTFMVDAYVELYLGLTVAYHKQTQFQKNKAKQQGGLKPETRDEIGLDAQGNGTVEIDGTEVTIGDKKAGTNAEHNVQE